LRSLAAFSFLAAVVTASVFPAGAGTLAHTVVAGDSLWTIARANHVSVGRLEALNHLTDASILQIGQSVVLATAPSARAISAVRAPHAAHPVKSVSTKVVGHRGIAVQHHTAVVAHHGTTSRSATPRVVAHRSATPEPGAAKNAVWVATHTGEAPPPPVSISFEVARRILAFDERVTHTALRYIGVPYVWGGTSFGGVDCSGFVYAVFEHNGIDLPRTADSQFEVGRPVMARDLQPGDLVFFQTYAAGASHVGIYLGGGRFVHASASNGVRIDDLSMDYYASRYIGARRLIR